MCLFPFDQINNFKFSKMCVFGKLQFYVPPPVLLPSGILSFLCKDCTSILRYSEFLGIMLTSCRAQIIATRSRSPTTWLDLTWLVTWLVLDQIYWTYIYDPHGIPRISSQYWWYEAAGVVTIVKLPGSVNGCHIRPRSWPVITVTFLESYDPSSTLPDRQPGRGGSRSSQPGAGGPRIVTFHRDCEKNSAIKRRPPGPPPPGPHNKKETSCVCADEVLFHRHVAAVAVHHHPSPISFFPISLDVYVV